MSPSVIGLLAGLVVGVINCPVADSADRKNAD